MKVCSEQIQKFADDKFHSSVALENTQKKLLDVRRSSQQARESLEESQSKVEKSRVVLVELQIELERERYRKYSSLLLISAQCRCSDAFFILYQVWQEKNRGGIGSCKEKGIASQSADRRLINCWEASGGTQRIPGNIEVQYLPWQDKRGDYFICDFYILWAVVYCLVCRKWWWFNSGSLFKEVDIRIWQLESSPEMCETWWILPWLVVWNLFHTPRRVDESGSISATFYWKNH